MWPTMQAHTACAYAVVLEDMRLECFDLSSRRQSVDTSFKLGKDGGGRPNNIRQGLQQLGIRRNIYPTRLYKTRRGVNSFRPFKHCKLVQHTPAPSTVLAQHTRLDTADCVNELLIMTVLTHC